MVWLTLGQGMPNTIFNFSDLVSGEDCSGVRFDPGLKMIPLDLENYSQSYTGTTLEQSLSYIKLYLTTKISKKLPKGLDHPMSGRALVPSSISLILSVGRTVLASAKVTRSEEVVILMMHKTVCRRFGHSNQDRQMLVSQRKNFSAYLAVFIR